MTKPDGKIDQLDAFFTRLHPVLFPSGYDVVSLEGIIDGVSKLTALINNALDEYHGLEEEAYKQKASPLLNYAQAVLKQMIRLARFEQKDLTKYNQILADLDTMVADKEALVAGAYKREADYQRSIAKDEKLHDLMDKFLSSCKGIEDVGPALDLDIDGAGEKDNGGGMSRKESRGTTR